MTGSQRSLPRIEPARRQAEHGLTLVELLVALTIAAILVAQVAPSFVRQAAAYRISGQVNGWIGDLQFARAEAIKRGQNVTLCISANGTACSTGTSGWQAGWIVFADADGNATVDAGEAVLRSQNALVGGNTFSADNNVRAVTFNRDGFAVGLPAGNVTLTLHDSASTSSLTRCVALTTVGRTAVQRAGTGSCS